MRDHRRLYRSRNGVVLGVCRGLAEYLEVSVFWTRVAAVLLLMFGFWLIVPIYIAIGFLLSPGPVKPIQSEAEQEFYNSYTNSRRMAVHRLKRTFGNLDRRIRRMEDIVTKSEYDWERRLNEQS